MTTESRPPRPEHELLLCCARVHMNSERAERIRALLAGELDWAYLLRMAHPHGMLPLLYRHLQDVSREMIPHDVLQQLKERVDQHLRTTLGLVRELLRLLSLFESQDVPVVPLKGAVLAETVYGNLVLRPFRDLDLLVRKQDVARAKALLLAEGYHWPGRMNDAQEAAFMRSGCELSFDRNAGRLVVELHWGIVPEFFSSRFDYVRLWERVEPAALAGRTVLSLSKEDLLLMLCIHGAKHSWERLEWICDVAEVLRRHPDLKWKQVLEEAGTMGAGRMLQLGLRLASDLLGAAVPHDIRRHVMSDSAVKPLAEQVRRRLCQEPTGSPGIFDSICFHLKAKERLRDRVRYMARLASTPSVGDWAMLPLPAPLSFLYYLLRPIRLLRKYGWKGLEWILQTRPTRLARRTFLRPST